MLGKLLGRKREEKAIIHESVPDEVLYPEGRARSEPDRSWMDDVLPDATSTGEGGKRAPAAPAPAAKPAVAAPAPRRQEKAPVAPVEQPALSFPSEAPNARAEARPRFPVGWLIVVEGPGTGTWAPLEAGVSSIGGPDATIECANGTAAIAFDKTANTFAATPRGGTEVRVNGKVIEGATRMRDGDVLSMGGTAMKLVALCNGNFRWSDQETRA